MKSAEKKTQQTLKEVQTVTTIQKARKVYWWVDEFSLKTRQVSDDTEAELWCRRKIINTLQKVLGIKTEKRRLRLFYIYKY